jgi:conjugal transfer mating pair stabilization protein TraN
MQWMDSDKGCNGMDCEIFKGQGYRCRDVLFGAQNCCDQPVNTTMADYIKLAYYTYKVSNASAIIGTMNSAGLGSLTSGYQALADASTATYSTITNAIITPFQSAATSAVPTLGDAAGTITVDTVTTYAKTQLKAWGSNIFGSGFADAGGNAAVDSLVNGIADIAGPLMTFMMYYAIAMILIQIIWACEDAEFELAMKRQMKSCHFLGRYCSMKAALVCIEQSNSYCCFTSPLARILQEQIRPLLGMAWPAPGLAPICSGITPAQMAGIDFSALDLSEFTADLKLAGLAPADAAGADSMFSANVITRANSGNGPTGASTQSKIVDAIGDPTVASSSTSSAATKLWGTLP